MAQLSFWHMAGSHLPTSLEIRLGHGTCLEMLVDRIWVTSGQRLPKAVWNYFCHSNCGSARPWRKRASISLRLWESRECLPYPWLVLNMRCKWEINFDCVEPLDFGTVCYWSKLWPFLNDTPNAVRNEWIPLLVNSILDMTTNTMRK